MQSYADIDALVGRFLTGEVPHVRWEDSRTHFQFETMEEAIESLHDPYFRDISPRAKSGPAVITEVKEFRCYSTDLNATWDAVEHLLRRHGPLSARLEEGAWVVAFGQCEPIVAGTAALALCLAALRARGIEVECEGGKFESAPAGECGRGEYADEVPLLSTLSAPFESHSKS